MTVSEAVGLVAAAALAPGFEEGKTLSDIMGKKREGERKEEQREETVKCEGKCVRGGKCKGRKREEVKERKGTIHREEGGDAYGGPNFGKWWLVGGRNCKICNFDAKILY